MGSLITIESIPDKFKKVDEYMRRYRPMGCTWPRRLLVCGVPLLPRTCGQCAALFVIALVMLLIPPAFLVVSVAMRNEPGMGILIPLGTMIAWAHPAFVLALLVGTPLIYTMLVLCCCRKSPKKED